MDVSSEYIKMCEKAEEIQEQRYSKDLHDGKSFFADSETSVFIESYGVNIWLPRQDQLQEMLNYPDVAQLFDAFFSYYTLNWSCRSDFWWKRVSMEQLWLAFVMKEKGKVWNGEEFIKS